MFEVDLNTDTLNLTVTLDIFRKSEPEIVITPQLINMINCIASERSTLILNPLEFSQFSHKMLSQLKLLFNAQQQKVLCENFASEGSRSMSRKSTFNSSMNIPALEVTFEETSMSPEDEILCSHPLKSSVKCLKTIRVNGSFDGCFELKFDLKIKHSSEISDELFSDIETIVLTTCEKTLAKYESIGPDIPRGNWEVPMGNPDTHISTTNRSLKHRFEYVSSFCNLNVGEKQMKF